MSTLQNLNPTIKRRATASASGYSKNALDYSNLQSIIDGVGGEGEDSRDGFGSDQSFCSYIIRNASSDAGAAVTPASVKYALRSCGDGMLFDCGSVTANNTSKQGGGGAVAQDDPFTGDEIFEIIRSINDPEHPLTLEELSVVDPSLITVDGRRITVSFTPTIPHCSMATLIGLCIRVKLMRSLPREFKVKVKITEGTHVSADAVSKQLGDKDRVAAALENQHLRGVVDTCLKSAQALK